MKNVMELKRENKDVPEFNTSNCCADCHKYWHHLGNVFNNMMGVDLSHPYVDNNGQKWNLCCESLCFLTKNRSVDEWWKWYYND